MSESHDTFGLNGSVIDARYRVDSVVGEGGFGVVYRGYHLNFKKPIAIKVLKAPGHFTPQARSAFVEKFREEGQLLSQLSDSPGVVRVYDFGVVQSQTMGPAPYLVLEWLDGQTLEAFLEQRRAQGIGPLPLAEAVALLAPAIDAVAYAHQRKIAHRDIKPANIFLVNTPRGPAMKVLDFGIGKAMQEGDSMTFASTGTKSGFHAFSPLYGAPEQFFSKKFGATGPWTDVHALALVLVEMLIGRTALDGDDSAELLVSATNDVRPTPGNRGLELPPVVEAVFQSALARTPQARFENAHAFLEALRAALGEVGIQLPAAPMSAYGNLAPMPASWFGSSQAQPLRPTGPVDAVGTAAWLAQNSGPVPGASGYGSAPGDADLSSPSIGTGATLPVQVSVTGAQAPAMTPVAVMTAPTYSAGGIPLAGSTAPGAVPSSALAHGSPATTAPGSVAARPIAAATAHGAQAQGTTSEPWAASNPGAAPTGPAAGRKRSAWPLALAGVVVVGGGATAAVLLTQQSGGGPGPGPSSSVVPQPSADTTELERTEYARQFSFGKGVYLQGPLDDKTRAGKVHVKASFKGDRPVSVQSLRPSGSVASELRFEHAPDGSMTLRSFDAYQVEQWTRVITPDGIATTTERSGVVATNGCYRLHQRYDAQGNVNELDCLSPTGVPLADANGCQVHRFVFDERRLVTTETCLAYDASGKDVKPIANANGVHLVKYHYDKDGQRTDETYFDTLGAAVGRLSDGCFGVLLGHDAAGNQTSVTCVDSTGGRRKLMGQQAASGQSQYDANGCTLKLSYFDVANQPSTFGSVAYEDFKVDANCNTLRHENHGPDGKLIAPQGSTIAATAHEYDDKGQEIARRCLSKDNAPINCNNDGSTNGALVRYTYDERGRRITERAFTADDKPSVQSNSYPHDSRTSYGEDGRIAAYAFFDEQGKAAVALGGVARMAYRYDALGGEVSEAYFGPNQEPIDSAVGCHEIRRSYDDNHRVASIECRDSKGDLKVHSSMILNQVTWPAGAARVTVTRSEYIVNVFTGPNGQEVARVDCRSEATPCHR